MKLMTQKKKLLFAVPLIFLALLLLVFHNYNDYLVTTRHGINFWNILFDGRILHFYEDNVIASGNDYYTDVQGCAYSILVYLVFAVWNIPLALLMKFTSIDVMNNWICLLWAKSLMVCATVLSAYILYKLMDLGQISSSFKKLGVYLYLSSAIVCSCVYMIGGYDIFSVVLQLLGIYYFIKNDNTRFILFFSIAFCFKFFSLLTFVPLVLLKTKKIEKILFQYLLSIVPYFIIMLPFSVYQKGGGIGLSNLVKLARENATRELFYLGYIVLMVWAFCKVHIEIKHIIWTSMVANTLCFALLQPHPFWIIFLAPYVYYLMVSDEKIVELLLYLETVGSCALLLKQYAKFSWCYGKYNTVISGVLGKLIPNNQDFDLFEDYVSKGANVLIDGYTFIPMVIVACFGMIGFLTYPRDKSLLVVQNNSISLVCTFRFMIISVVCFCPSILYVCESFI